MDDDMVMEDLNCTNRSDQINIGHPSIRRELIIQLETELNEQVYQILNKQFPNLLITSKKDIKSTDNNRKHLNLSDEFSIKVKNNSYSEKTCRKQKFNNKRKLQNIKKPIALLDPENAFKKELVIPLLHNTSCKNGPDTDKSTTDQIYSEIIQSLDTDFELMSDKQKKSYYYMHTFDGFTESLTMGKLTCETKLQGVEPGKYVDCFGFIRWMNGPFWPSDYGPLHPAPFLKYKNSSGWIEPFLDNDKIVNQKAVSKMSLKFSDAWEAPKIVYNAETFSKNYRVTQNGPNFGPSLHFESRFESGNLYLARQIDHTEFELVLRNDLYTCGHTQWFYFRLKNMVKGLKYHFKIINLTKKSNLYLQGMQPVMYSEHLASAKDVYWHRSGCNINYSITDQKSFKKNMDRKRTHYTLQWTMEFPQDNDTCYVAHCYPYTYSDLLKDVYDLVKMENNFFKLESLCLTRARNTCFLITIDDPGCTSIDKRMIIITARIHPGETNSSFIMKGLLELLSGSSDFAKELRKNFVFKIIPMLNPDGVIVGNYRCSLIGRDLNRNFLNPSKTLFPTVYHLKQIMERFKEMIILYCDLHGHNQKQNVFMYGCPPDVPSTEFKPEHYLRSRIIPWMMSKQSPDKFIFDECYFHISKSKESTGRVVMSRQFNVVNSFTLEATFCGTSIFRKHSRQFNIEDFEDVGRSLCEVISRYHKFINDKEFNQSIITELVSDLKGNLSKGLELNHNVKTKPSSLLNVSNGAELQSMNLTNFVKVLRANDMRRGLEQETDSDTESEPEQRDVISSTTHKIRIKSKSPSISAKAKKIKSKISETHEELTQAKKTDGKQSSKSDSKLETVSHPSKPRRHPKQPRRAVNIQQYKERSNGGIPCFVQERLECRAERKRAGNFKREEHKGATGY